MSKIEAQAPGVQPMIQENRYYPEIIQQLTALSRAAEEVSLLPLRDHIEGWVADAMREQRGGDPRADGCHPPEAARVGRSGPLDRSRRAAVRSIPTDWLLS